MSNFLNVYFHVLDVNECLIESCGNNSGECVNLINQGFNCSCFRGYELTTASDSSSIECLDVDECLLDEELCDGNGPNVICRNTLGNYTCQCATGFNKPSEQSNCTDVNECQGWQKLCLMPSGHFSLFNLSFFVEFTMEMLVKYMYKHKTISLHQLLFKNTDLNESKTQKLRSKVSAKFVLVKLSYQCKLFICM